MAQHGRKSYHPDDLADRHDRAPSPLRTSSVLGLVITDLCSSLGAYVHLSVVDRLLINSTINDSLQSPVDVEPLGHGINLQMKPSRACLLCSKYRACLHETRIPVDIIDPGIPGIGNYSDILVAVQYVVSIVRVVVVCHSYSLEPVDPLAFDESYIGRSRHLAVSGVAT